MTEDDQKAPWTIKAVATDVRKLATSCATKRGVTVGDWLSSAVKAQAALEAGDRVQLPNEKPATPPAAPMGDLAGLAGIIHAATEAANSAGVPLPKATARQAFQVVNDQLRAARGLPPRLPRKRLPQTLRIEGSAEE